MNENITAIVTKCENLSLKVNVGERYRISKVGLKGSLWLELQQEAFRLKLTGEVKFRLSNYVTTNVGSEPVEDQGDPVCHQPLNGTMEMIVSEFNKI